MTPRRAKEAQKRRTIDDDMRLLEPDDCGARRPGPHPGLDFPPRCNRWPGHAEPSYPHDQHEYGGVRSGAILWPVTAEEAAKTRFTGARITGDLPAHANSQQHNTTPEGEPA